MTICPRYRDIQDEMQRLQVRSVPLGEQPYRVAYQQSTNTLVVCTSKPGSSDV